MRKINVKRVGSLVLGIIMVGSLVSCGQNKEVDTEATLTPVVASKDNMKFVNEDGEEVKYINNISTCSTTEGNFDIFINKYIVNEGVNEEENEYSNVYYGHKTDEKYGKSDWIRDSKWLTDKDKSEYMIYKYMFDKNMLDGSIDVMDTGITEYVRNITQVPLTDEEVKLVQEKFTILQTSNEGKDRLRINQEDTYYSLVFEFDNKEKIVKTTIYMNMMTS